MSARDDARRQTTVGGLSWAGWLRLPRARWRRVVTAGTWAATWDLLLFGRNPAGYDATRTRAAFKKWLGEQFAKNAPYDRWVRDLMLAEEEGPARGLVGDGLRGPAVPQRLGDLAGGREGRQSINGEDRSIDLRGKCARHAQRGSGGRIVLGNSHQERDAFGPGGKIV